MAHSSIGIKLVVILLISFLLFKSSFVHSSLNDDDQWWKKEDDDNTYKSFGVVAGPLLIVGGSYVVFMWTRPIQHYLFTTYRKMDPKEVKKIQRQIKPWLHRVHMLANSIAPLVASIHGVNTALLGNITGGGLAHLLIWPALILLGFYLIAGLILKFRRFSIRVRRIIRKLHTSRILLFLLAGFLLGHVLGINDDYLE